MKRLHPLVKVMAIVSACFVARKLFLSLDKIYTNDCSLDVGRWDDFLQETKPVVASFDIECKSNPRRIFSMIEVWEKERR